MASGKVWVRFRGDEELRLRVNAAIYDHRIGTLEAFYADAAERHLRYLERRQRPKGPPVLRRGRKVQPPRR
jgi:hypothetical protein